MPNSDFDSAALNRIPAALQNKINQGELAGVVTMIWRRGELIQLNTLGKRNIEAGLPMERGTLFRIASMTKPVTSVAMLMLLEEGEATLCDPITKWAPEFASMRVLNSPTSKLSDTHISPRDITIEDLLTHRAGFSYGFLLSEPIAKAYDAVLGDAGGGSYQPDAWLKALSGIPLNNDPGDQFLYGHATDVLGFLVARISGTSFRDYVLSRILSPLGMNDTDFCIPAAKQDRSASIYKLDESGVLRALPFPVSDTPNAFCSPGGGLISSADDYLRFARMLLRKGVLEGVRLLKPETVTMMLTDRLTRHQHAAPFMGMKDWWAGQGYGLGVYVVTDPSKQDWLGGGSLGAFGWPGAFTTWWQADPAEDMVLLFLAQHVAASSSLAIAGNAPGNTVGLPEFQRLTYSAIKRR